MLTLIQMSGSKRPTTPIWPGDSPSRPQIHGESARTQDRSTRKGVKSHDEVTLLTTRPSGVKSHDEVTPPKTRSSPNLSAYSANSRRSQPKSWGRDKASVRKRPSTVHTPKFRDMILRLQHESSEDIRLRTTGRLRTLHRVNTESNASGEAEPNEFGEVESHSMSSGSGRMKNPPLSRMKVNLLKTTRRIEIFMGDTTLV